MNLGLGNLDDLKQFILAEAVRAQTDNDVVLQAIGKGVAAVMERHCNRWFARVEGAVDTFTADHDTWTLSRFPVEVIDSVEVKTTDTEGWVAQSNPILISELERGFIDFGAFLGDHRSRVRIAYTGGYFFETLEPSEEGYPTTRPQGSTARPDDLKLAWLLQCQHVFEGKDHMLPKGIAANGAEIPINLKDVVLLPAVVDLLRGYIRYQLT
jgi:hypothetical protein